MKPPRTTPPTVPSAPSPSPDSVTRTVRVDFTDPLTQTPELTEALTELLHSHGLRLAIRGTTKIGAPKVNPEGETTLVFSDINRSLTLPTPKAARKWLRKHSHSVTTARKEKSSWIFLTASPSVKVYFKSLPEKK